MPPKTSVSPSQTLLSFKDYYLYTIVIISNIYQLYIYYLIFIFVIITISNTVTIAYSYYISVFINVVIISITINYRYFFLLIFKFAYLFGFFYFAYLAFFNALCSFDCGLDMTYLSSTLQVIFPHIHDELHAMSM